MALDPAELIHPRQVERRASPVPLAGSRSQAMQRLQVGVFGLAAMLLLVGLANIIMTNARENDAQVVPQSAASAASAEAAVSDPLADAGVVPDMPSSAPAPAAGNADGQAPAGR